jgi:hypothetical protein
MIWRRSIEIVAGRMAALREVEFVVTVSPQPGALGSTLCLLPDPALDISNGRDRSRTAIDTKQL